MFTQLPGEVIEDKYIQKYDEMVKFKNTKIRHLLQYLLLCSFIVFQPSLCAKVLDFADERSLKITVNHD
jgi:hypothetical protein